MINNRQAGRRRGRNNNQRPNGGGNRGNGDSGNRIDNRARGNAAQLLEKYRNMARDAQLSGDRVNFEYYLQFADHYFRVLADNRARQEENQQRFQRNDEPVGDSYDGGDDSFGSMDDGDEGLGGDADSHQLYNGNGNGNGRDNGNGNGNGRDRNQQQGRREDGRNRDQQQPRRNDEDRDQQPRRNEEGRDRDQQPRRDNSDRPRGNREDRAPREERAPREARGNREERAERRPWIANDDADESTISLAALPPAIGRVEEAPAVEAAPATDDAGPAKPRRGRPRRQAEAAE